MLNPHLLSWLHDTHSALREQTHAPFSDFLAQVLPSPYRFGTGEVLDQAGHRTGRLDIVVEGPFAPSLPLADADEGVRLYLAESVAAVVEVKADLAAQWPEVLGTAQQLGTLTRKFSKTQARATPSPEIPLFVVGYAGWSQIETVCSRLAEIPTVSGILVLAPGIFVSHPQRPEWGECREQGPWALWRLLTCLWRAVHALQGAEYRPESYAG